MTFFLVFEEPFFYAESSAISDEVATFSDDTMTGDDDKYGIFIIRSSYGSYRFGMSREYSLFCIIPRFSVGYSHECFPGIFLEICTLWSEWYVERFSLSREVFVELLLCSDQNIIRNSWYSIDWISKIERYQMSLIRYSIESPEWCG